MKRLFITLLTTFSFLCNSEKSFSQYFDTTGFDVYNKRNSVESYIWLDKDNKVNRGLSRRLNELNNIIEENLIKKENDNLIKTRHYYIYDEDKLTGFSKINFINDIPISNVEFISSNEEEKNKLKKEVNNYISEYFDRKDFQDYVEEFSVFK